MVVVGGRRRRAVRRSPRREARTRSPCSLWRERRGRGWKEGRRETDELECVTAAGMVRQEKRRIRKSLM